MDLLEELIAEIISRTPVRTIVSCKSVCKRWCNIVSEPFFSRLHLSISSKMLLLHQGDAEDVDDDNDGDLAVVELDDQHHQHDIHHEPMMRFSPGLALGDYVGLIGSVNGLICLEDSYDDSAYVCNPITQEYIRLQDSEYTRVSYLKGYYGFRLVESNQQYKIVRFYKGRFPSTEYDLGSEVYTLGTGMWRDLGHVPFHLNEHDRGHYVSGRLHWLAGELICVFDLDRELFRQWKLLHGLLGIQIILASWESIIILGTWEYLKVARDYGVEDSWSKKLIISPNPPLHEGINTDMVRLLKVLKDGNILMYCDQLQLFTYHPQHKTLRHHIFPEGEFLTFGAMTYVPGFISLERSFTLEGVKRWESPQVED
ncbi:F-box protein At3g07870-like [Apium graveolens]|uniref:F-box protein At3g07870-like n=1 Tax=Apium graveolens TaxID=4045 RepID=UPI003D7B5F5E